MSASPAVHCAHDEMVPIAKMRPHPRNPNTHPPRQIELLAKIIREQGWRAPITVSERSGHIVRGHGRLLAARLLNCSSVPVDHQFYESDAAELADLIADNRIAEFAVIDDDLLADLIGDLGQTEIDMELTGFDAEEMSSFLADIEDSGTRGNLTEEDDEVPITRAEELREKWHTKSGQLWELGEHRLLCGDSTTETHDGCRVLVFDPEWDAMPTAPHGFNHVLAFCDGATLGSVIDRFGSPTWVFVWDCVSSWYTPNRPLRRMKMCAWYGPISDYNFDGWHYGDAGEQRNVWNSRGSYHFNPDPRGKHLSDVFQCAITRLHADGEHNHKKPLDWISLLVGNCTVGDVYDPFAGSGTTILACEQLGRKCRAVEIDPGYVAVALERWSTMTGREPRLI